MKLGNTLNRFVSALSLAGVLAITATVAAPVSANAQEIKLATADEALQACKENKLGQWDIAYFIGKDGIAQWGSGAGYDCKQAPVSAGFSGVGNAIQAGGKLVTLASPEDAAAACKDHKMGEWDIAYFVGKGGIAQWGWGRGYDCKQAPVPGAFSGVGNAIIK